MFDQTLKETPKAIADENERVWVHMACCLGPHGLLFWLSPRKAASLEMVKAKKSYLIRALKVR